MYFHCRILATLAASVLVAACASKPVNTVSFPSQANATVEIENTERMINEARQQQVDVLSPKNFAAAEKSLAQAKKMKEKEKPNEKILAELAEAQGFLMDAKGKSEISSLSMKTITTAREDALNAGASQHLPKEWRDAEKDLESVTKRIEKGDLVKADKDGNEIIAQYRELEIKAVQKAHLSEAAKHIEQAKKEGAQKKSPKSLELAEMKFNNATKLIVANPKNTEAIRTAASDATRESVHLTSVLSKVKAGNSEELVLMAERQQRQIGNLRQEASSVEEELASSEKLTQAQRQALAQRQSELQKSQSELQKTQETLKTAENLRQQFRPNEAEVFVDQGKIVVRLKALQFPPSQSNLGPKNQAFLKKVENALQNVEMSKLTVEGHTDATGNADKNAILSEKRAQTVEQYFTAQGTLQTDQVQAVGLGSDKPISDNTTARGRAENRRIDLVIETQ